MWVDQVMCYRMTKCSTLVDVRLGTQHVQLCLHVCMPTDTFTNPASVGMEVSSARSFTQQSFNSSCFV